MEVYDEIGKEEMELHLNDSAKGFLKEVAKWTYFLSILGYIGIGFIVLIAIFAGAIFAFIGNLNQGIDNFGLLGGGFISSIYLILAALYFFPIYYLNKFSSKLKLAIKNNDSDTLASSFEYLKSHYKYIGIMAVVMLSFYALIIIGAIVVVVATGLNN